MAWLRAGLAAFVDLSVGDESENVTRSHLAFAAVDFLEAFARQPG